MICSRNSSIFQQAAFQGTICPVTLPAVEAASPTLLLDPHNLPSALLVLAEILRAPALAYLSVAVRRLARVRVLMSAEKPA